MRAPRLRTPPGLSADWLPDDGDAREPREFTDRPFKPWGEDVRRFVVLTLPEQLQRARHAFRTRRTDDVGCEERDEFLTFRSPVALLNREKKVRKDAAPHPRVECAALGVLQSRAALGVTATERRSG